ncbi:hypothetical protein SPHINGO391_80032 [Sphingomonas aurantiaca]|uniref:Uncharacterized protein n=1 Tax=Sphingomonas aurantiaca TaxID=185949 RepID=A0A5E8AMN6_9SPHN|nr:hypothetical protein SPHINGO391_80032 [Sphingomonas aurantiaca]
MGIENYPAVLTSSLDNAPLI